MRVQSLEIIIKNRYKWTFFKDVDSKDFDIKQ